MPTMPHHTSLRLTQESEREAARFEEETVKMREEIHDLASQVRGMHAACACACAQQHVHRI